MSSILSRIVLGTKNLLLRQVLYLDKQCYQLSTSDGLTPVTASSRKILVVSRHNYTEQIQWLPVGRRAEAKKLVKFQQSTRAEGSFYILGQPLNGKTPVVWYQLKPQLLSYNALLYLPETALLAMLSEIGDVLVYQSPDHNNDIFVSRIHAGVASAIRGVLLQSTQQFMLAQGSTLQQSISLSAAQHKQCLVTALFKLQHLPLVGLVNKSAFRRHTAVQSVKQYLWPLAGSITLYLLLASYWAQFQLHSSQQQLQLATREANQLLIQRDDINSMLSRFQQLQQVLPGADNLLQLWQVLAPLYQQGIIISNMQQSQQQVRLSIEATSAVDALQLLVQQPGVTQASLEGNVRRQGNKDVATFSFVLRQEGL